MAKCDRYKKNNLIFLLYLRRITSFLYILKFSQEFCVFRDSIPKRVAVPIAILKLIAHIKCALIRLLIRDERQSNREIEIVTWLSSKEGSHAINMLKGEPMYYKSRDKPVAMGK